MTISPKNLQIQCNHYQVTNGMFFQNKNKNFKTLNGNTKDSE